MDFGHVEFKIPANTDGISIDTKISEEKRTFSGDLLDYVERGQIVKLFNLFFHLQVTVKIGFVRLRLVGPEAREIKRLVRVPPGQIILLRSIRTEGPNWRGPCIFTVDLAETNVIGSLSQRNLVGVGQIYIECIGMP